MTEAKKEIKSFVFKVPKTGLYHFILNGIFCNGKRIKEEWVEEQDLRLPKTK